MGPPWSLQKSMYQGKSDVLLLLLFKNGAWWLPNIRFVGQYHHHWFKKWLVANRQKRDYDTLVELIASTVTFWQNWYVTSVYICCSLDISHCGLKCANANNFSFWRKKIHVSPCTCLEFLMFIKSRIIYLIFPGLSLTHQQLQNFWSPKDFELSWIFVNENVRIPQNIWLKVVR